MCVYIFKYGPQMTYGWSCWFCWCNSCDLFPFPNMHAPRITWILTSMSSESVDLNTMVCEPEKIVGVFPTTPLRSSSKLTIQIFISQKLETPWNLSLGGGKIGNTMSFPPRLRFQGVFGISHPGWNFRVSLSPFRKPGSFECCGSPAWFVWFEPYDLKSSMSWRWWSLEPLPQCALCFFSPRRQQLVTPLIWQRLLHTFLLVGNMEKNNHDFFG